MRVGCALRYAITGFKTRWFSLLLPPRRGRGVKIYLSNLHPIMYILSTNRYTKYPFKTERFSPIFAGIAENAIYVRILSTGMSGKT